MQFGTGNMVQNRGRGFSRREEDEQDAQFNPERWFGQLKGKFERITGKNREQMLNRSCDLFLKKCHENQVFDYDEAVEELRSKI